MNRSVSISILITIPLLVALSSCGEPPGGGTDGVSYESADWEGHEKYVAVFDEFSDALERADSVVDSIDTPADAIQAKDDLEGLIDELGSLSDRASNLDLPPQEAFDALVALAEPADEAQQELLRSIDELRSDRRDAAITVMTELTRLRGATMAVMRATERPNRDEEFAEIRERMREEAERADRNRAGRRGGPFEPPKRMTFEESRTQLIEQHGAENVLTIMLTECPVDLDLGQIVDLVKSRIPADSHCASGAGRTKAIALAPVSMEVLEAIGVLDIGTLIETDNRERRLTIMVDPQRLPSGE